MKGKQVITLFCFVMLMCQLLPVRQLGKLLFKNGITEELSHDDCSPDCKDHFPFKKDFIHADQSIHIRIGEAAASQYIHFADTLPTHLPGDIQTPPPDIA